MSNLRKTNQFRKLNIRSPSLKFDTLKKPKTAANLYNFSDSETTNSENTRLLSSLDKQLFNCKRLSRKKKPSFCPLLRNTDSSKSA